MLMLLCVPLKIRSKTFKNLGSTEDLKPGRIANTDN